MTFFPPDPAIPEPEESESPRMPWWGAPEDELPAMLPVAELLAVTDHAAVVLAGVAVYSGGVEFRIEGHLRRGDLSAEDWRALCEALIEHHPYGGDRSARLRLGVELGDGEQVLADRPFSWDIDPDAEPQGHVLTRTGGGGGGGGRTYTYTDRLWLWPLPPAGALDLVLQWPAIGIGETRLSLPAAEILDAARRARPFWP